MIKATIDDVDELQWTGPTPALASLCEEIDAAGVLHRAERLASQRG